jgi:hypothetical protein
MVLYTLERDTLQVYVRKQSACSQTDWKYGSGSAMPHHAQAVTRAITCSYRSRHAMVVLAVMGRYEHRHTQKKGNADS